MYGPVQPIRASLTAGSTPGKLLFLKKQYDWLRGPQISN